MNRASWTNGSFYRDFAANFSSSLIETRVNVIGPGELECYFGHTSKVLVKIDAEGAEPEIISALAPLIQTHRPDLLIEILQDTVVSLESCSALTGYAKFLITEAGLRPELSLLPHQRCGIG